MVQLLHCCKQYLFFSSLGSSMWNCPHDTYNIVRVNAKCIKNNWLTFLEYTIVLVSDLTFVFLKKASSYITQYPVLRTVQSTLHFSSLIDLFTRTPSRLLWEASSHMLQLMREGCSYTYPLLSIARYSFIQLSELEQCRVTKLAQGFNTAAQDLNLGSRSRESEALPLSHCALLHYMLFHIDNRTSELLADSV